VTVGPWWLIALGVAAGVGLLYVALLVVLLRVARHDGETADARDVLRLLPDVVRLLRRLAADPALPRGVRFRLLLVVAYVASPIDLVPDFIPLLGYLDDAVVVAVGLRSVIRHAGPEAVDRHWSGSPAGLRAVLRLAGTPRDPR